MERLVFDVPVICPGGEPIGEAAKGSGCRCRIEHSSILTGSDMSSLRFCAVAYRECPTWRAEKQRIAEGRRAPLVAV